MFLSQKMFFIGKRIGKANLILLLLKRIKTKDMVKVRKISIEGEP